MSLHNYQKYIKEALSPEEIEERKKMALASHMKLYVSKKLADILKRMESPIANDLLTLARRNIKFDISFMDVSGGGMVTFIRTSKVVKMEKSGLNIKTARNNYNSELWTSKQRVQPTRIGKIVTKIFKGKYSTSQFEQFGNEFKSKENNQDDKMKVVYGEDIRKYYHENMYNSDGGGTLSTSCMRHPSNQSFFDLYCSNIPKDAPFSYVGLLILLDDDDKLIGRAIVWFNSVRPEPGLTFMDRIYYTRDSDQTTFIDYAKKHGWLYKKQQTYNNADYIDSRDNSKHSLTITFRMRNNPHQKYPFMDTLIFYTPETGRISSKATAKQKKYKTFKIQDQYGNAHQI